MVESLETRALLTYFQVVGGVAALAQVDGPSTPDYKPLSSAEFDTATESAGSDPYAEAYAFYSGDTVPSSLSNSSHANLTLSLRAQADFVYFQGSSTTLEGDAGTSTGGAPGQWLTITLVPTGNEHVGDPVKVTLSATGSATAHTVVSNLAIATHYEVNADFGSGTQQVISDGISSGPISNGIQSQNTVSATMRLGQTFRLYADIRVGDTFNVRNDQGGEGRIDLNLSAVTTASPGGPLPDIRIIDGAFNSASSTVRVEYATTNLSRPFILGIYLSANTSFEPSSDRLLASVKVTPTSSAPTDRIVTLALPRNISLGTSHLLAVGDPPSAQATRGQILESQEDNNVAVVVTDLDVRLVSSLRRTATLLDTVRFGISVAATTASINGYGIQVKQPGDAGWTDVKTQGNAQARTFVARLAGTYLVRAYASIDGFRFYSQPTARGSLFQQKTYPRLTINFPNAERLVQQANLGSKGQGPMTHVASQMLAVRKSIEAYSLAHSQYVMEAGFVIQLDTQQGVYRSILPVKQDGTHGQRAPSLANDRNPPGVTLRIPSPLGRLDSAGARSTAKFNQGAVYTVASFHTHTPMQFRPFAKLVGPSQTDVSTAKTLGLPGLVIDYQATGSLAILFNSETNGKFYPLGQEPPLLRPILKPAVQAGLRIGSASRFFGFGPARNL